jgi:hypothetical protein
VVGHGCRGGRRRRVSTECTKFSGAKQVFVEGRKGGMKRGGGSGLWGMLRGRMDELEGRRMGRNGSAQREGLIA